MFGGLPQLIHDRVVAEILGRESMVLCEPESDCVEGYRHLLVVLEGVGSGYYVREDLCPKGGQSPSMKQMKKQGGCVHARLAS